MLRDDKPLATNKQAVRIFSGSLPFWGDPRVPTEQPPNAGIAALMTRLVQSQRPNAGRCLPVGLTDWPAESEPMGQFYLRRSKSPGQLAGLGGCLGVGVCGGATAGSHHSLVSISRSTSC